MSTSRHHNEWLSLLEVSGPFLSLPILLRVFPQGLEAIDREQSAEARLAYEEWVENQGSLRPEAAIHSAWVRYVLERVLGLDRQTLLEGPAIPAHLKATIAEHGETLRPDLVIADPHPPAPSPSGRGGEERTSPISPLPSGEGPGVRALLCFYPSTQKLESPLHDHRWKASPAMRMMELLRATGVPLGLATNGEQWMLVHAPRGETSSFISWYASLWFDEPLTLRAFTSLLGATRFFGVAADNTLEAILKASADQQQEVTDQLGYQVRSAVEVLIRALDKADQDQGRALLGSITESDLYEAALTVMMRLVFLFSAEERGLLLLGDPIYDQNYAVSTLRAQLRETADQQGEEVLERRFDAWQRLIATFRAVYGGIQHDRLHLPAYGGSLFDPNKFPFLEGKSGSFPLPEGEGAGGEGLPINNRTVLHLLESLQILRVRVPGGGPAEARRLSFRALDVEQIGHVYEGLLDHIAVRAPETVLGLSGAKDREPEIPLSKLEAERKKGGDAFVQYLVEETGRSESALKKLLQAEPDGFAQQRLKIACNNDESVYKQVLPYAGLLREDDFGYPAVFLKGSVYITTGSTRRATGTHYTPRSLTEPIVQHTLEPLVYTGPAEGLPKDEWELRSPAELLELKVCDPAMGSAGFLVQVIRYLSERLVEAWEAVSLLLNQKSEIKNQQTSIQITPEGLPATGAPGETIIPNDDDERLILARRLAADRCIYGVDKNPLAVEIAKLSIWLTTMDKGRPFGFLDHALKCGDSLVGASADDFLRWARGWRASEATLFDASLQEQLQTARQKRRELEAFQVLDVRDAERKAELLAEADAALARVKRGCDLLVGARLLGLSEKEAENLQLQLLFPYMAGEDEKSELAQAPLAAAEKVRAFHWEFEFPEMFEKGGFSAFIGNPPFLGGTRISTLFGSNYLQVLQTLYPSFQGRADLCSLFFLRAFEKLNPSGKLGLIATNTIAQGDTQETGLSRICSEGGEIYNAISSKVWPGEATVYISVVHISKPPFLGMKVLNEKIVEMVNDALKEGDTNKKPVRLVENSGLSYTGSKLDGIGFVVEMEEARALLESNPENRRVLWPYLTGQDLVTTPDQSATRFVIYFGDWERQQAEEFPGLFEIVKERVYLERQHHSEARAREKWWQFQRIRPELYVAIHKLGRVLGRPRVSNTHALVFIPEGVVISEVVTVFLYNDFEHFCNLQSSFHELWAQRYGSTLGQGLRYTSSDVFDNFPVARNLSNLRKVGEEYYNARQLIAQNVNIGLTTIFTRLNNPKEKHTEFAHLRALHVEMDNAVAAAYGWSDLNLGHGFHETLQGVRYTISEAARREVLARLLKLNHERYEEEVRQGLHEKKAGKAKGKETKNAEVIGRAGKPAKEAPPKKGKARRKKKWEEDQFGMF